MLKSVAASNVGRTVHDLGLAALLGGQLFGRLALHPAVKEIGDPYERGRVVNQAWRRYGVVNSVGLVAVGAGWLVARVSGEVDPSTLSAAQLRLMRAKDVVVPAAVLAGAATGLAAHRLSVTAGEGEVPMEDGDTVSSQASSLQIGLKRIARAFGTASIGADAMLVVIDAVATQTDHRRSIRARRPWHLRG